MDRAEAWQGGSAGRRPWPPVSLVLGSRWAGRDTGPSRVGARCCQERDPGLWVAHMAR